MDIMKLQDYNPSLCTPDWRWRWEPNAQAWRSPFSSGSSFMSWSASLSHLHCSWCRKQCHVEYSKSGHEPGRGKGRYKLQYRRLSWYFLIKISLVSPNSSSLNKINFQTPNYQTETMYKMWILTHATTLFVLPHFINQLEF
jgi:hypothetical protein